MTDYLVLTFSGGLIIMLWFAGVKSLAGYAASLSTINSLIQVTQYLRNRACIKVGWEYEKASAGRSEGLYSLTATNNGGQPVTLRKVLCYPKPSISGIPLQTIDVAFQKKLNQHSDSEALPLSISEMSSVVSAYKRIAVLDTSGREWKLGRRDYKKLRTHLRWLTERRD